MAKLSTYIQPVYLTKERILEIRESLTFEKPFWHCVLDDFLHEDIIKKIDEIFSKRTFKICDNRIDSYWSNSTIFVEGDFFYELFEFFQSKELLQYLQLLYGKVFERQRYLPQEKLQNEILSLIAENKNYKTSLNIEKEHRKSWGRIDNHLWIAQMYETGDFSAWHTDIAKDIIRDELVAKWGYELWHQHKIEKFEEVGAFIFYLYNSDDTNWDSLFWGNLELWEYTWGSIETSKTVTPRKNRLVLLSSSNISYHRVSPLVSKNFRISFQDLLIDFKKG